MHIRPGIGRFVHAQNHPRGTIRAVSDPDIKPVVLDDGAIYFDARYFPVLFVTWFGVISEPGVKIYSEWVGRMANRAHEGSTRMFVVEDITDSELPTPDVRKMLADTLKQMAELHGDLYLGGAIIIPNTFMRAAFTIVKTLSGRLLDYKPVGGLDEAMARGFAMMDAAGIARPAGLDAVSLRRPERPTE